MVNIDQTQTNSRIRLLYLIGGFQLGGTAILAQDLLKRLDPARFDASLAVWQPGGELWQEVSISDHKPLEWFMGSSVVDRIRWIVKTAWWLRKERIDVLHCWIGMTVVYGSLAARLAHVPVVVLSQLNMGYWIDSQLKRRAVEFAYRHLADVITVNAESIKSDVVGKFGVQPERVQVVYNGIESTGEINQVADHQFLFDINVPEHALVIGYVGTLRSVKGVQNLIEAASVICERFVEVHFVLVGDGPSRLELQTQAERLGLADRIHFAGYRADVLYIIPSFDIAVLPSLTEGFPQVVLEYMLCGRPIIATRTGGVPEIISDMHSGLLIEPGSVEELVQSLVKLIEDKNLQVILSQNASRVAVQQFNIDKMVQSYQNLYTRLLFPSRFDLRG